MAGHIKITLTRSVIGQMKKNRKIVESLGLRKVGRTRVYSDNNCIRGMVNKVKHLVRYELISE